MKKVWVVGSTILNELEVMNMKIEPFIGSALRKKAFEYTEQFSDESVIAFKELFMQKMECLLADHQVYPQLRAELATMKDDFFNAVTLTAKKGNDTIKVSFPNKKYAEYMLGVGVLNRRGAYNVAEARDFLNIIHPRHEIDALMYLNCK